MFSFNETTSEIVWRYCRYLCLVSISAWLSFPLFAKAQTSPTEPEQLPEELSEAGPCGILFDLQHEVLDPWQVENGLSGRYLCDMEGERDDIQIDPVFLSCIPSVV